MVRAINEADIHLDGAHHDSLFSQKALSLLNQAAQGTIDPERALKQFVENALEMVDAKLKKPPSGGIDTALEMYQTNLQEIQETLNTNSNWVYDHLDLPLPGDDSSRMKSMSLLIRSKAIRANLLGQAEMADKIESVKQNILKNSGQSRKPNLFEDVFRHLVVQRMTTEKDQERMQKFFAIPPETYNDQLKGRVTHFNKTKKLLIKQIKLIDELAKKLKIDMYHLRVTEEQQRGDTMKALRFAKGWTQEKLAKELKKAFPEESASQSTISRSENGSRPIDADLARKLGSLFDVPIGLLVTQFFND
jgi:DNA-binding XRE family transcriptional regulator